MIQTKLFHAYLKRKLEGLEGEGLEREGEPEGRGVGEGESHTPHIIKAEKSKKNTYSKAADLYRLLYGTPIRLLLLRLPRGKALHTP